MAPPGHRGARRLDAAVPWLLLFGWAALGVGWLVGVALLLRSPTWTAREKLLGVLVLPFGLGPAVAFAASVGANGCTAGSPAAGCAPAPPVAASALMLLFLVAAPVTMAVWLARARRARAEAAGVAPSRP